ncbi:MAG: hypothetical protein QXY02_04250 [Conexivisphaerales archaeon]
MAPGKPLDPDENEKMQKQDLLTFQVEEYIKISKQAVTSYLACPVTI